MALSRKSKSEVFTITPEANSATDTANFAAAVNALPSGGGTIIIRDNAKKLYLDSAVSAGVSITKPVFIRGETRNAQIESRGDGHFIAWGGFDNPPSVTANTLASPTNNSIGVWAFSGIDKYEAKFQSPNLTLAEGDWVLLMGDDPVPGNVPHNFGSETRPAEIHKVAYVSGGDIILSSPVKEDMTINPRLQKLSLLRGCGFCDLRLSSNIATQGTGTRTTFLSVDRTLGFRVENVEVDQTGIGSILVRRAIQTEIANFSGRRQPNPFIDYSVVVMVVNGFRYTSSQWEESRHVFTTGGYEITGGHRYGGTLATLVDHVAVSHGGDIYNQQFAVFDTHPEGSDIKFESCHITTGMQNACNGYNLRAKRNRLVDCSMRGGKFLTTPDNTHAAVKISSSDNEIVNCHFERVWQGVRIVDSATEDNQVFANNAFVECSTTAVQSIATGVNNIQFFNNRFRNCGSYDNTGSPDIKKTIVNIIGGTGHVFRNNEMDLLNNDYTFHWGDLTSADMTIEGNYCRGYGSGKLGIRGAIGDPNAYSNTTGESINSLWASSNYID